MKIHSEILVHWTGKDIEKEPKKKLEKYISRLKNYYDDGIFLNTADEYSIRYKKIKKLVRVCFTEIRSARHKHMRDAMASLV